MRTWLHFIILTACSAMCAWYFFFFLLNCAFLCSLLHKCVCVWAARRRRGLLKYGTRRLCRGEVCGDDYYYVCVCGAVPQIYEDYYMRACAICQPYYTVLENVCVMISALLITRSTQQRDISHAATVPVICGRNKYFFEENV